MERRGEGLQNRKSLQGRDDDGFVVSLRAKSLAACRRLDVGVLGPRTRFSLIEPDLLRRPRRSISAPSRGYFKSPRGSSTVASDEKGLAISPAPCYFVFGVGLFSESQPRPPLHAFPSDALSHSP